MSNSQDHNARVRQMREAGDSIRKIALALNLPMASVRMIARRFETEAFLSSRSSQFLERIRKSDDPDQKWKVGHVIQALQLKTITQNALIHHFEGADIPEVSLRELMDLAISE